VAGLGLLLAALVHLRARLAAWQAEVAHQVRLRAEALERRRQVERALMDHYDALVILLDREGRYLELNREARHLLEVEDSRQVVGKYLEEHLDPKSAPRFRQLLRQALAQGEARLEGRWLHFAGRERYLEVVARTIGNPWDQSLLLILRDLSDQKLRDHKLWETERLASLGLLAAGVAHQVNNPLGVLLGFCELLLDRTPPGAEGRRELEIIHQQGQECKRIVDGLLSYSRLSDLGGSGGDLVAALRAVLEMVSGVLSERGIELEVRLPQELPPTPAPAGAMQQVFLNLIANAMEAMPGGGRLMVEAALRTKPPRQGTLHGTLPAGRRYIEIAIEDTGCGIPPEHQEHIFDPFFTTKEVGQGTGLGLWVAYGIVREAGGTIVCQSPPPGREEAGGTRFTLRLPLAEEKEVS
jgi:PAS domain S-box-containing protein